MKRINSLLLNHVTRIKRSNDVGRAGWIQQRNFGIFEGWLRTIKLEAPKPYNDKQNQLYSWGEGNDGQLGHGTGESLKEPKRLDMIRGFPFTQIAAGLSHVVARTDKQKPYNWGSNAWMQLGQQQSWVTDDDQLSPVPIESLWEIGVEKVACGFWHSLVITSAGGMYSWGNGAAGQLGLGSKTNYGIPTRIKTPKESAIDVSCGALHSACVTESGLYLWGAKKNLSPTKVDFFNGMKVTRAVCGAFHTMVMADNNVYVMGKGEVKSKPNDPHTYSNEDTSNQDEPKLVLKDQKVVSAAGGSNTCIVALESGEALFWDNNTNQPQALKKFKGQKIVEVAMSPTHCAVITDKGELFHTEAKDAIEQRDTWKQYLSDKFVNTVAIGWNFTIVAASDK